MLALEQLRILSLRLEQLARQRPARIMAVTSAMANEGKSTISANLALVLAKDFSRNTLLVDADFRHPSLATWFGGNFSHGLREVLKGEVPPAAARWQMREKQLTLLPLIAADPTLAPLLSQPEVRKRFAEALQGFDTVIIDTPPMLPLADCTMLADFVDGFIFVVKAEETPRRLITSATRALPADKLLGYVLNGAKSFGRTAYGYLYGSPRTY
ncbi:MAG: CpsD/CapB family tyrosine-protein kinase [Nitrospirota bacterium]